MANSESTTGLALPKPAPATGKQISLQRLLRNYRKTWRDYGNALEAEPRLETAVDDARRRNADARTALIEAPIVSLEDVAMKLRFFFEVEDEDENSELTADEWGPLTLKAMLRDIDNSKGGTSLRALRQECVSAFRASSKATEVADKERFRVRKLHPPCPNGCWIETEGAGGSFVRRPGTAEDFAELHERGDLSAEELEECMTKLREWQAACDAIDAQHPKVAALREADEAAEDLLNELDNQFVAAPAHTLEDIGVKLRFLATLEDMTDHPDAHMPDRLVFGLIRDITRMTGAKF